MSGEPLTPGPERDHDRILDHDYDGIREYDNPLPAWWTLILWGTILYSVLYALNLPGIGTGRGRIASYEAEMERARIEQAARDAAQPAPAAYDDAALRAFAGDPARVAAGKRIYAANCTPCHREDGGGTIGPNLTDEFWIHGGRPAEMLATVARGVPDKGMPTWSQILRPEEVAACVAYVMTLHDTHPPDPKEPQGARVASESDDAREDRMSALSPPVMAPDRVLPTLNTDGSRRWLRPKPSHGRYWRARRAVAIGLMLIFFAIPYLTIGGRPAVLLDLQARRFTLLGTTFMPTETVLFMLVLLAAMLSILLFTALFGRVWCGWACPQTVYMEYLFRPFERWIEGGWQGSQRLDRTRGFHLRRAVKLVVYLGFALFLAHTFLAYFVPVDELARWVRRSPFEHPTSFLVMLATTGLILFDFGWFREQTCLVACPYGRLQSALLDRRSWIVGYDPRRGEPRQKGVRERPAAAGDCIDCRLCVLTCPTGIDIRDGLQMECLHCTQCADACDAVMDRVGKPRGLIRYTSIAGLEGAPARGPGARRVLYPAALALCLGALGWGLASRTHADVMLLRGLGEPFTRSASGAVVNQVRVKLGNREAETRRYRIELLDAPGADLIVPRNPVPVAPAGYLTQSVFVILPPEAFRSGERAVRFRISDDHGWSESYRYRLAGPSPARSGDRVPGAAR